MQFYKGNIINPENFRQPSFFISPFQTRDLEKNKMIIDEAVKNDDTVQNFFGNYEFFLSGKAAIHKVLGFYNLKKEDEVLILTTSANLYVSSCVTGAIEKFCTWSRVHSAATRLIFVIHEFGKVYEDTAALKKYQLPVIEDCAMSLFSNDESKTVGSTGDFVIYSLPKFFPVQYGGVLKSNLQHYVPEHKKEFHNDLHALCSSYLKNAESNINRRKDNYNYLMRRLGQFGFAPFFHYTGNETPSVCMFRNNGCDLPKLKIFLQNNGVECSVFYGEDAFFIPVHQNLGTFEMNFIINLLDYFVHESK